MVCNKVLDHKAIGEGSQINVSLSPSYSEISSHKEGLCWFDSVGKKSDVSTEAYKKGEVLNSEILNEMVDIHLKSVMIVPFKVVLEISLTVC